MIGQILLYKKLMEVSPEWLGSKLGGALSKIEKIGAKTILKPGPSGIKKITSSNLRGKYNRVMGKAIEYNKKKYVGKIQSHMSERFVKAVEKNKGTSPKKSIVQFSSSGWQDPAFIR